MGLRITGFGWWEYDRKTGEGSFHCSKEGAEKAYELRRVNRWITLLYVPVVPLGTLGQYVKCKSCKARYGLEVLSSTTSNQAPAASAPTT